MITPLMLNAATWAVEFSFCAALLFMIFYTLLANWWKSAIGWARISLDFGIALALSPTVLHLLTGLQVEHSLPFYWYQIGAICFVGCISLWNAYLVCRVQLRAWCRSPRHSHKVQLGNWYRGRKRVSSRRSWPRAKGNLDTDV